MIKKNIICIFWFLYFCSSSVMFASETLLLCFACFWLLRATVVLASVHNIHDIAIEWVGLDVLTDTSVGCLPLLESLNWMSSLHLCCWCFCWALLGELILWLVVWYRPSRAFVLHFWWNPSVLLITSLALISPYVHLHSLNAFCQSSQILLADKLAPHPPASKYCFYLLSCLFSVLIINIPC